MRYASRSDFLAQVRDEHRSLLSLLEGIPPSRRSEPGVWGDGWTVCDLLAHLAEWHSLFLGWFREGERGLPPQLPAPGYKWNETPRLNREIWARNRGRSFSDVFGEFESTFGEILALLEGLSEEELMEPGHFPWTGANSLLTYAGANTASHYRFAQKVLKRWLRTSTT